MKMVKLLNASYTLFNEGNVVPMFTLDELRKMNNVSNDELSACVRSMNWVNSFTRALGFVEQDDSTDEEVKFITVTINDVEIMEE